MIKERSRLPAMMVLIGVVMMVLGAVGWASVLRRQPIQSAIASASTSAPTQVRADASQPVAALEESTTTDAPQRASTWEPPVGGYEDLSTGGPGDGLDIAVANAQLVAFVTVTEIGPPYWNSEDNAWWVANPHESPDTAPLPLLGRDVTVVMFGLLHAQQLPAGAMSEMADILPTPALGQEFTIYVPGGIATITLDSDQQNAIKAYLPVADDSHGDDEGASEHAPSAYHYERMPSMVLEEGAQTIVFLVREGIPQRGAPERPAWIGVAGPFGSNWVVEGDVVFSPLRPDQTSSLSDFAIRLNWLSNGRIDTVWVSALSG